MFLSRARAQGKHNTTYLWYSDVDCQITGTLTTNPEDGKIYSERESIVFVDRGCWCSPPAACRVPQVR